MANRYWVGGTASWNGTIGTVAAPKWAATSGGTGDASVPTTTDAVFIDSNPAPFWTASTAFTAATTAIVSPTTGNGRYYECTTSGTTGTTEPTWPTTVGNTVTDGTVVWTCRSPTVTIATGNTGAQSIDCTGFTGTLAGSTGITLAGSLTLVTGMTCNYLARITYTGTATITSAGKTLGPFTVNTAGITVTLGDAYTFGNAAYIVLAAGTLTTNNYNITSTSTSINSGIQISGTGAKTLNLGSSTITINCELGSPWDYSGSNLTLNAGTSTIVFARSPTVTNTQTVNLGGRTYYDVTFQSTSQNGTRAITGTNTFNNLTLQNTGTGINVTTFAADQTVNGTLNCSGGSAIQRNFLRSNAVGTTRTLTVATLTATDCDFRDITISGAAAGSSPTRAGDCKGNSGINFPAAKTVYWNLAAGGNWSATGWAASSGAAPAVDNFPLAQDTAVVEATGLNSGTTLTINTLWNIGSIDLSARTANTVTLASSSNNPTYYGNYTLGTGVTVSGTGTSVFAGRATQNINTAGRTITFPITIDGPGTAFTLLADLTANSSINLLYTTINLNNFNLSGLSFTSSNTNTRTIALGSGTFTVSGSGTSWSINSTNLTITGTGTVSLTSASAKTFAGGGGNYSGITLNNGGAGALTITGSNTFGTLSNTVQPTSFLFTAATTTTITNWNINGTAGNLVTIGSVTAANHTLTKASGTVSADYLSISRSTITGSATWYAGANSTDGGNNSTTPNGWIFTAPPGGNLAGSLTVTFSTTAVAAGTGKLSGASDITATLSGTLVGAGVLTGSSDPTFSLSGTLTAAGGNLAGSSDVTFSTSAIAVGAGKLAGSSDPAFSLSGTLVGAGGNLSGSTTVTFSTSGTVVGAGALTGSSDAAFSTSGTAVGAGALAGSSDPAFSLSGTLTAAAGNLVGSVTVTFTTDSTLSATASAVGSTDLTFTATATPFAPTPPTPTPTPSRNVGGTLYALPMEDPLDKVRERDEKELVEIIGILVTMGVFHGDV